MHYAEHPLFEPPADRDSWIWRYLDFTKLVALLDAGALFFARSDTLGDPFEGSYSRANVAMRPTLYADSIPPEGLAQIAQATELFRLHTYLNCWNLSDYESAALWGLYVPPHGGVAIRSTFARLTESFIPSAEDEADDSARRAIFVGRVRYADYEHDFIPEGNTLWPFVHKRRSFDFENELRAVIQDPPSVEGAEGAPQLALGLPSAPGRLLPVDLAVLIDSIFVSPVAPGWFAELVASVCARYDLDKRVEHSNLSAQPVY